MRKLLQESLNQDTVTNQEANTFNANLGPCCDTAHFRVHLDGTTCNGWNKSAIRVFTNDFLTAHPEYPSHEEPIQDMVKMKSQATLDSMIREHRKSKIRRTNVELRELQKQKNRQERKRKVSIIVSSTT